MLEDQIVILHPEGKRGVNVSRRKYEVVRAAILDTIRSAGEITFLQLFNDVIHRLADDFDGAAGWYVTTVKFDLEARGIIERNTATSPHHLRLAGR